MYCCPECFGDRQLKKALFPIFSEKIGTCSYCKSQNQPLAKPQKLSNYFESLIGIYSQNEKGVPIVQLLKDDWLLFPSFSQEESGQLLGEILEDLSFVGKLFEPIPLGATDGILIWEALRTELMHQNRFFPKSDFDAEKLAELFRYLSVDATELPEQWFRARLQTNKEVFSPENMRAPPKNLATHGRANPTGISYLYIASTCNAAISEIRPQTGALVSVAEVTLQPDLKFVDLRNPRLSVSPFMIEEQDILTLRSEIPFLEVLGSELTRPVLPHEAAISYIPSQFLCEFIKNRGYHGVLYKSSVSDGVNLALFNPDLSVIGNVQGLSVSRVTVETN